MARRAPRQGAGPDAERLGDRLRARRAGQHGRDADLGLARRVLRRRAAGAAHIVDPAPRRGARHLAPDDVGRSRPHQRAVRTARRARHDFHHADERVHAVRVVGPEQLGAGLSELLARAGRHRIVFIHDVAIRDRDAGGDVVRLRQFRLHRRRDRQTSRVRRVPRRRQHAPAVVRFSQSAGSAAAARSIRGVLWYRLLQRFRRGDRRALSDVGPGHRGRRLLQHRPARQRRCAVHRRIAGQRARFRRGVRRRRRRLPAGGPDVDWHS